MSFPLRKKFPFKQKNLQVIKTKDSLHPHSCFYFNTLSLIDFESRMNISDQIQYHLKKKKK